MSRTMGAFSGALAMLAAVLSACSASTAVPAPIPGAIAGCSERPKGPNTSHHLTIGTTQWSYLVHTPPGYAGQRLPVVYLLHGLGGNAGSFLTYTLGTVAADQHEAIVVAPQSAAADGRWNVEDGPEVEGSDMDFMRRLMARIPEQWCADPDRQFVAGFSNGSLLTQAMACTGEFEAAAYGGVAGPYYDRRRCGDAPAVSLIYLHGTDDRIVPYAGGATPLFPVRGADEVMGDWADHDTCRSSVQHRIEPDVAIEEWSGCDEARLVFYTLDDAGHTWPGATTQYADLGATNRTIKATDRMFDFFGID